MLRKLRGKAMKYINLLFLGIVIAMCSACKTQTITPAIVPPAEIEAEKPFVTKHSLGIIGAVEPVYVLPMKAPLAARIDTGAETSSIDVSNLKSFERDGDKWVSFTIVNRDTGETHRFEKEVVRQTTITRINVHEKRLVVMLDVKLGNEIVSAEFSLANREKFEYQALIGRNILTGRAIVDTALENTLH